LINTRSYKEVCEELTKAGIIAANGDIWTDLESLKLGRYYQLFFEMGQTFLDRQDQPFTIAPARLYFNNINDQVNACARQTHGFKLIEFNLAVITQLFHDFYPENDLFDVPALESVRAVAHRFEQAPAFWIFQELCLFIFLHEAGHLVQVGMANQSLYEEYARSEPEQLGTRERHTREADADCFAGSSLADHLIAQIKLWSASNRSLSQGELENILGLTLSAIYLFFGESTAIRSSFYTEMDTHPHPIVRLFLVVMSFLGRLKIECDTPYRAVKVVEAAKRIAYTLLASRFGKPFSSVEKTFITNRVAILDYMKLLRSEIAHYPFSSSQFVPAPLDEPLL